MNYEQNLVAIDRENITWKQNHSSCGSRQHLGWRRRHHRCLLQWQRSGDSRWHHHPLPRIMWTEDAMAQTTDVTYTHSEVKTIRAYCDYKHTSRRPSLVVSRSALNERRSLRSGGSRSSGSGSAEG